MTGRVGKADQALAVPATPANAVDGPSGFDPSRIAMLAAAAPLLDCEHYVNAPHDEGRLIGFVVPDSDNVLLTKGTAAARAVLNLARIAAQRIEAGTDETLQAAQPEGREPDGEADAPETKAVDPYALGGGK